MSGKAPLSQRGAWLLALMGISLGLCAAVIAHTERDRQQQRFHAAQAQYQEIAEQTAALRGSDLDQMAQFHHQPDFLATLRELTQAAGIAESAIVAVTPRDHQALDSSPLLRASADIRLRGITSNHLTRLLNAFSTNAPAYTLESLRLSHRGGEGDDYDLHARLVTLVIPSQAANGSGNSNSNTRPPTSE